MAVTVEYMRPETAAVRRLDRIVVPASSERPGRTEIEKRHTGLQGQRQN